MAESDNPLLPLQRPPFGNPATHKAHPPMFQAEYDIRFRHPAYEGPYDIFIVLPGLDHPEGGIHHQTALLACAVIANNSFSGWLIRSRWKDAGQRTTRWHTPGARLLLSGLQRSSR